MACILRYLHNSKPVNSNHKKTGPLAPDEIDFSFVTCIKLIQAQSYKSEIAALQQKQPLPSKSPLLSLRPFLDSVGLLRVGGRLQNAPIPFDAKHQMLLPRQHHFVKSYIRYVHLRLLHASSQTVMAEIRQRI